jgi:DMSO/TMAO reductase YedYZ molybdopterin-dependent catalytic subunit
VTQPGQRRYGRGAFLLLLGGGLTSLAWAQSVSGFASPITSSVSQLFGDLFPVGGWRIYTVTGSMPEFDRKAWRLNIGGLVANPVSFTYDDLLAMPQRHQVSDFHCVTGWTVHNVHWRGVRFEHLLDQVGISDKAKAIRFQSLEEPYNDSLTLDQVRLKDVMVALEMDGKPLTRAHGAPARVVIPEMYGYKGVKWLTSMELVAKQPTGYWEQAGYDQNAWVGHSNGYGSSF